MFGLFIIEAGKEPVALVNREGKPLVFDDGRVAASVARTVAAGDCYDNGYVAVKVQPRRLASDAWKVREGDRFRDGTYTPLPWADLPSLTSTADHFAHVSTVDGAKVAYTQDAAKGAGDIQTRVKPGKYLQQFYGHLFDAPTIASMAVAFSLQFDEPNELKFVDTADEIERVYRDGPHSCMAYPKGHFNSSMHPCRIYAAGDLAVAYFERNGQITARALVWPAKKLWVRIYGDAQRLQDLLEDAGYEQGDLDGARMLRMPEGNGFVMPYLDHASSAGDTGKYLIIGGKGVMADRTDGLSDPMMSCEACGDSLDEDDASHDDGGNAYCHCCWDERFTYCEHTEENCDREGSEEVHAMVGWSRRPRVQTWGAYAIEHDATRCEGTGDLYHNDLIVLLADGTAWSQAYFEDHGFVCQATDEAYSLEDLAVREDGKLYSKGNEPDAEDEDSEGEVAA